MGSPRPRMQAPWHQRYQDGAGTSPGSPSPTSQSAAASMQFQDMKAAVHTKKRRLTARDVGKKR